MPPKYHHTVERWVCPLCNGNLALDTSVTLQEWSPGDLSVGPLGPTPGGFGPLGPTPRNLGPLGRTPQMVPPPKRPRQPLVPPPSAARQPRGTMIKDDSISVKGPCTPQLAFVINSGGLLRGTDALDHRKPKLCIAAAVAAVAAAFAAAAAAAAGSRNVPKARRIEGSMQYMVSRAHSCHQPCALSTRPYTTTDNGHWSTCCLGRTVVMSIRNVNIAV